MLKGVNCVGLTPMPFDLLGGLFAVKNEDIGLENTYYWNIKLDI